MFPYVFYYSSGNVDRLFKCYSFYEIDNTDSTLSICEGLLVDSLTGKIVKEIGLNKKRLEKIKERFFAGDVFKTYPYFFNKQGGGEGLDDFRVQVADAWLEDQRSISWVIPACTSL